MTTMRLVSTQAYMAICKAIIVQVNYKTYSLKTASMAIYSKYYKEIADGNKSSPTAYL